ncbi:Hydroxamate-type ferrichrome siderophore peptide synthetase [Lachnellula suecica]|uniref:Hydroxamate-type ferrichrome siderophore peptide synthetase n=1 Tax=Lachnellula suecica TaxID=602035 RepID=A0A8T9CHI3_9HELO|nr:Hydroxamate-type ferrichrome siderophore peptide synthetase [Lachnellula suecica]
MFPLMNTVAVRSVLHGSLGEMLKYMQDLSDTTRQYQHFPLGTAQAYAFASRQDNASSKVTTLFDTLFIYQGRRQSKAGEQLYEAVYGASNVEFPVCVEMEIVDDEYLSWTTACKSIARTAGETEGIIEALDTVLRQMISAPDAPAIVSDAEGVTVCGLPKFRKSESKSKEAAPVTNGLSDEWSGTELAIRKALHEMSDVAEDNIRKDSTIFHLGLDSILVLRLPALLRGHDIKLSVSDILREQNLYSMAQCVLRSNPEGQLSLDVDAVLSDALSRLDLSSELEKLENEVGEIGTVMPVTAGQLYMIRQWQASRGALFYPTFTYTIEGRFNNERLDAAWESLLRRNAILRTGFVEVGSDVVQVTYRAPMNEVNYTKAKPAGSNLRSPPVSLVVEEAQGSSITLKLTIHHALYDGISLPILVDELQTLYKGGEVTPPSGVFKTFVAQSISAASASAEDKWTAYLNGSSTSNSIAIAASNKRTEVFHPSLKVKPLRQLAQDSGVSVDALFLAGIAKQYAQHLQSSPTTVVFGIYFANRAPFGEDLSSLAAPTLNLLPLRVNKPLERKIPELAKDIQRDLSAISSKEMAAASLEQICRWTGVKVDFFVNILKSATTSDLEKEEVFRPLQEFEEKAETVEQVVDENICGSLNGGGGAYLPTIDVEIRYEGDEIDMGVFAPSNMLGVEGAEELVRGFRGFWA